jgi:hypothetical protein
MQPLRIFIGYDSREPVAYHVFAHSILARASQPVAIIPLKQDVLRLSGAYWRDIDAHAATEFSLTRFLVPYLSGYKGRSIFADCDMLAQADIVADLLPLVDQQADVFVCQHDYAPTAHVKMDGQQNAAYPKKNWSSFMVFNNAHCRMLTPEYVNSATPAQLHRFEWAHSVGSLPLEWNWLVGEYAPNAKRKILHYTLGGPWFRDYRNCDGATEWREELSQMLEPHRPGGNLYNRDAWMAHA